MSFRSLGCGKSLLVWYGYWDTFREDIEPFEEYLGGL